MGGLLLDLRFGERCGRHAVDGHLILPVAKGIILLTREDILSWFDIAAGVFVSAGGGGLISRCFARERGRVGVYILSRFLRLGILFALGRWDFAFNREGYTVGAGHTKTGSIAADLFGGDGAMLATATGKTGNGFGATHFSSMAGLSSSKRIIKLAKWNHKRGVMRDV